MGLYIFPPEPSFLEDFILLLQSCLFALWTCSVQFSSVAQSCPTLWPHELQHARPSCPSPTPRVPPNSCSSSWWCHPAISSSVVPFSSCPQSLPASESFPMSQLLAWGGQSPGVSALASVLPKNTQDWSPLEWTGWFSLQFLDLLPKVNFLYNIGSSNPVLCENLEVWDGVQGGKEVQEEGDICIPVADSCWCLAETNTIYKAIIL